MRLRRARIAAAFALLATACAAGVDGAPRGDPSAELTVEVYSGFAASGPALVPAPVHFVVDVTSLLDAEKPTESSEEQQRLAQTLIGPYLERHTDLAFNPSALHVFHRLESGPGDTCADPTSGASFAASRALMRLQKELETQGAGGAQRVVLLTAFETECAPRLCETAGALSARGAWLDVAALGSDVRVPACLENLRPAPRATIPWLVQWSAAKPPAFTIEAVAAGEVAPQVLARGSAGVPVRVSAGLRRIRIALGPPELVGPIQVRPNQRLRIRVMDFPLSAPGARSWQVEVIGAER
jgi:hypothetical protein